MVLATMTDAIPYQGKWLRLVERGFVDAHGQTKCWEFVSRSGTVGAVCIVLVEQFRPPVNAKVLEFPAGLIEPGHGVEATALRELEEETGYVGTVKDTGPAVYNSPGLTDEHVCTVTVEVTGRTAMQPEPDEAIEVVELPLRDLRTGLQACAERGVLIDGKLWYYAEGLARA